MLASRHPAAAVILIGVVLLFSFETLAADQPDWAGLVQVGEPPSDKKPGFNFTDVQGARPKPAPADFDRDGQMDLVGGDTDLVYHTSARITCYVERSFLKHGYGVASIVTVEHKTRP